MASRRRFIKTVGGSVATAFAFARALVDAATQPPGSPPPGAPSRGAPPRDFSPNAPPAPYPDPDIVAVEPEFRSLILGNTPLPAEPLEFYRHQKQPEPATDRPGSAAG